MRAVNLIPADARRGGGAGRAGRSGGLVYVALGGLTVLVAMVALWALAGRDASTSRTDLAKAEQRARDAERLAAPLAAYEALAQTGAQQLTTVKSLAQQRFDWADMLGSLARILPGSVRLDTLTGSMTAVTATSEPLVAAARAASNAANGTTTPAPAPAPSAPAGAAPAAPVAAGVTQAPVIKLTGCAPSLGRVAKLVPRLWLVPGVSNVRLGPATVPSRGAQKTVNQASGVCEQATFELTLEFAGKALPAAAAPTIGAVPASTPTPTPGAGQ